MPGCPLIRLIRYRFALVIALLWSADIVLADPASQETLFREHLVPLLKTYCLDCHDSESDISLQDDHSARAIRENRELWVRSLAQVRLGSMPPEDGETMDPETRKSMVKVLDELVNAIDCVRNPNAGKVALRRLNRSEYRNTVRDLTGVDYKQAMSFPGDDVGYGFDNIGDVLSLPPLLIERYLDASETVAGKAIWTPPPAKFTILTRSPLTWWAPRNTVDPAVESPCHPTGLLVFKRIYRSVEFLF